MWRRTSPNSGNFEQIWRDFRRRKKLEPGGHTAPDWRGEHTRSAAFVIPVEVTGCKEEIAVIRDALRPFPFVSLHPDHFMHISLVIIGFLTAAPESPGEFSREDLASLAESAAEAVSGFGEFRIDLENLGLFPSAAFIEAHDRNGEMESLRRALLVGCGLQSKPGPPHLTLAYFKVEEDTDAPDGLIEAVEPLRNRAVGSFTVRHVDLTVLDLRSEYARPEVFARLPLR